MCPLGLDDELEYWGLEGQLEPCCQTRLAHTRLLTLERMEEGAGQLGRAEEELRDGGRAGRARRALWRTMEKPESGLAALLVSRTGLTCVILSTCWYPSI